MRPVEGKSGPALVVALRRARGLSQEELAHRSGVSARSIGKLERGQIARPRSATLIALADAFGLTGADRDLFVERVRSNGDHDTAPFGAPAQLPAPDYGFVGRRDELDLLDELLLGSTVGPRLVAVEGTGGIGKTGLAVHWARRARGRFPDGQLYARLHGFSSGRPADPADIAADFLTALGVPAGSIPPGPEARSALLRTCLAGKQVLMVLDDAADADHVRPLLACDETGATLITTRRRMVALVVQNGCQRVELGPLPTGDSAELLRIGMPTSPDPHSLQKALAVCAGIPLALRILNGEAQDRGWQHVTLQLDASGALDAMSVTDDSTANVRKVLTTSVARLGKDAGEVFRLLGLAATPRVPQIVLTAMASWPLPRTVAAVEELIALHLATPDGDRVVVHDLVQEYARELVGEWPSDSQDAALERLAGLIVDIAEANVREHPWPGEIPQPGLSPLTAIELPVGDKTNWLMAERAYVALAIDWACTTRTDALIVRLADSLRGFLRDALWDDHARRVHVAALGAARRLADDAARGRAVGYLGSLMVRAGSSRTGCLLIRLGAEVARRHGDLSGEAQLALSLGDACYRTGQFRESIAAVTRVGELHEQTRTRIPAAFIPQSTAICYLELGLDDKAEFLLRMALHADDDNDFRDETRGHVLSDLGVVCRRRGDLKEAAKLHEGALEAALQTGRTELVSENQVRFAEVCIALGRLGQAGTLLASAAELDPAALSVQAQDAFDNTRAELAEARGHRQRARQIFQQVAQRAETVRDQIELDRARAGLQRLADLRR